MNKLVNVCTTLSNETTSSGTTCDNSTSETIYAVLSHTHVISEVDDLQDTIDSKAEKEHTHKMSDITDLSIDLAGVASIDHTHEISEITNLQTTLDSKYDTGYNHDSSYAALRYTHTITNITNLQSNLDSKAASSHTHAISDITNYISALLNLIYPVGSIYDTYLTTDAAELLGFGTWEKINEAANYIGDPTTANTTYTCYSWLRTK